MRKTTDDHCKENVPQNFSFTLIIDLYQKHFLYKLGGEWNNWKGANNWEFYSRVVIGWKL